ncbi:MAG: 1-acyl-sn-glycerol-3-phosphate acyltransferase [Armatimonadota bacterium]|nr:1-acyl-sn-glycerol-3-phosphate acyltransferase [Armatimonadota bacterium]
MTIGLFLLGPVRVRGKCNVSRSGGVLIVANHLSDCDPAVLGYALPRGAHYMAKRELFSIPILSIIIRVLNAFPVDRGSPDRAAIRKTVDLLKAGEAVVVFPEGQLSETGTLQPLLPGVAMIVVRSGAPVVCVGLTGTARIIPFGSVWPRPAFGGVGLNFGQPKRFEPDATHEQILHWMSRELLSLSQPV